MNARKFPRLLPRLAPALACAAMAALHPAVQAEVLFDNGPAVIDGLAVMPSNESRIGFAIQAALGHRIADDFTIGSAGATVTAIDLFSYINNAGTFQFQDVSWSILAGASPNNATLIAKGNVAPTSGGIVGYRVESAKLADQTRPIWRVQADIADVSLAAGQYWLTWSLTSPDFRVGPWQAPTADNRDGNLSQSFSGGSYVSALDPASGRRSDLPFVLYGTVAAVPDAPTWLLLGCGLTAVALRSRRTRR